jgi:hypothetical protein
MGAVPVQKMVIQVFDARPDTAETEEAISKFNQWLGVSGAILF